MRVVRNRILAEPASGRVADEEARMLAVTDDVHRQRGVCGVCHDNTSAHVAFDNVVL